MKVLCLTKTSQPVPCFEKFLFVFSIKVIEHEIVKEAILQSCWVIIEFHLEHNDDTIRNFHSKIVMQPRSKPRCSRTGKDIQISTTFQVRILKEFLLIGNIRLYLIRADLFKTLPYNWGCFCGMRQKNFIQI